MRDFNHIIISPYLKIFGKDMAIRWNLNILDINSVRSNPYLPAIVLGMHRHKVKAYNELLELHKGPMIIFFGGGGDLVTENLEWLKKKKKEKTIFFFAKSIPVINALKKYGFEFKEQYVPFKDYSPYKPVPLGKKIYCHVGLPTHPQALKRLGWETMVKPLIKRYGNDVLYVPKGGRRRNQSEMINIYKQCCVYVKPVAMGGSTTMWEMAYMGRKTISHGMVNLPHIIQGPPNIKHGKNLNKLYALIDIERAKEGMIQLDVSQSVHREHISSEEWLNLSYWK